MHLRSHLQALRSGQQDIRIALGMLKVGMRSAALGGADASGSFKAALESFALVER